MTSEVRELLQIAAEAGPGEPDGARAAMQRGLLLRWRRRAQVAVLVAITAAIVAAVALPRVPLVSDAQPIAPGRPEHGRGAPAPTPPPGWESDVEHVGGPQVEARPGAATSDRGEPGEPAPQMPLSSAGCDPLIVDAKGDLRSWPPTEEGTSDNPAIDILEASMTYDASAHALVIRQVIDDIPDTPPFPNEALGYEFFFTLEGTWYLVMSHIGPASSYEWYFSVQRDDRTRADDWPNVPRQSVMNATGQVDTSSDTVTVEIDIDEFNRGEGRVAEEEGLPPAAELRRGSRLTNINMFAYPRSAGPGAFDEAYGLCNYVVPES